MNLLERFESALPEKTKRHLRRLGELAGEAYLVGGPLRDLLLGRAVSDFDVVVRDGVEVARTFASEEGLNVAVVYASFGTATVFTPEGTRFDLVTARRERYPGPGALPVVEPGSFEEDLRRRDFTINALAMSLRVEDFGEIWDVVGGVDDLRNGIVRALHPHSFVDDPTRIFRAYRFAERFCFGVEPQTEGWIRASVAYVGRLSGARVRNELKALLREPRRVNAFRRLHELGALNALAEPCPFDATTLDRWERLEKRLSLADAEPFLLAWFGRWPPEHAIRVARWLNLEAPTTQALRLVLERWEKVRDALRRPETPPHLWYRLLSGLSENALFAIGSDEDENAFYTLRSQYERFKDVLRLVTGEDVLAIGVPPGPEVQHLLDAALDAQLDGEIRTRSEALEFLRRELLRRPHR